MEENNQSNQRNPLRASGIGSSTHQFDAFYQVSSLSNYWLCTSHFMELLFFSEPLLEKLSLSAIVPDL